MKLIAKIHYTNTEEYIFLFENLMFACIRDANSEISYDTLKKFNSLSQFIIESDRYHIRHFNKRGQQRIQHTILMSETYVSELATLKQLHQAYKDYIDKQFELEILEK